MILTLLLVLLGAGRPSVQSFGRSPIEPSQKKPRQPAEYMSNSGAFVFKVTLWNPQSRDPFPCGLVHDKEIVWSATLPWDFQAAGVADDGAVVGYENGEQFRIVVLDPKGVVRMEHAEKYTTRLVDVPGGFPSARDRVLIHNAAGIAWIRVDLADGSRPQPWWTFRLSSGERADDVRPDSPVRVGEHQALFARDARVIGNTGLTLCSWLISDYESGHVAWAERGGVFSLVDLQGRMVWSLELRSDYTDPASEAATEKLTANIDGGRVILSTGPGDRFALWDVHDGKRIEYEVKPDATDSKKWSVTETSRTPFEPDTPR